MSTIPNDRTADVPWPTSSQRMPAPDHSALPDNESTSPGATGMLKTAVQGAHDTLDRLADRAAPAVQREWVDVTRGSIRKHPLTAVAIALAVGAAVARMTRR
jgi:ElaB/YqjD/DUF883 family membrane-anchored ribosome-binding protein